MRKIVPSTPDNALPISQANLSKIIIAKTKSGAPVGMVVAISSTDFYGAMAAIMTRDPSLKEWPGMPSRPRTTYALVGYSGKTILETASLDALVANPNYDFFQLS